MHSKGFCTRLLVFVLCGEFLPFLNSSSFKILTIVIIKLYVQWQSEQTWRRFSSLFAVVYVFGFTVSVPKGLLTNSGTASVLCREGLWGVVDLKMRYRNSLNEWMNNIDKAAVWSANNDPLSRAKQGAPLRRLCLDRSRGLVYMY